MAKLPAGTLARITVVLKKGEERTAFMREAIEREIERRQLAAKRGADREPRRRSKR
jgi:hypothetical protein